jgi:glutamate-1-semialdehyde 2,1-aminomutase
MISERLYEEARRLMPGGVSSPVRAYEPYPRYIESASGSRIWDVDGKEYIDYCMAFGPLILGHAHPHVIRRVKAQIEKGSVYGAPIELEIKLAKKIKEYYDMDMLRFTNSGTEATMSALRVARGYTGKDKIIGIEGAFHGSNDSVLPSSAGIPEDFKKNTILVPFNDIDPMRKAIKEEDIACVIIEPIMGNLGVILPKRNYLSELRSLTEDNEIILIFDEVITGFRLKMGGASDYYDVKPDMTILGKIVGGGFPIGVFGGKREIMEKIAPCGDVYQAGTFSGNPVSLTAGMATIEVLEDEKVHERIDVMGERMREGLREILNDLGLYYVVQGIGSIFQLFFTKNEVYNREDARSSDDKRYMEMFRLMLNEGIFLAPSQFETNFIAYTHTNEDIERTLDAYEGCLSCLKKGCTSMMLSV